VLSERHGLTPEVFGMCFGLVVAGYLLGSLASGRLVRRFGGDYPARFRRLARRCRRLVHGGAGVLGSRSIAAILGPMFFCTVATGLVMPNAIAKALAPYPAMAGSASALMGFVQMTLAAWSESPSDTRLPGGGGALAAGVAICTAARAAVLPDADPARPRARKADRGRPRLVAAARCRRRATDFGIRWAPGRNPGVDFVDSIGPPAC
jgi:DHA1 family bicyclomycin/chloramphenicol resistance-like MFS transporter